MHLSRQKKSRQAKWDVDKVRRTQVSSGRAHLQDFLFLLIIELYCRMIFEPVTQPLDKDNAGSMVDMTCHSQWLIRNTTRQQKIPLRGHPSGKWIRSGAAAVHDVRQAPQNRGGMKYSSSERGPKIHCLEKTKQISCVTSWLNRKLGTTILPTPRLRYTSYKATITAEMAK